MVKELPITKKQFKDGITNVLSLVVLGISFPMITDILRSQLGYSAYNEILPLVQFLYVAIGLSLVVAYLTESDFIKFKTNEKKPPLSLTSDEANFMKLKNQVIELEKKIELASA